MKFIVKLLLSAFAVIVLAELLKGIQVDGYLTAVIVALVLGLLRSIVKPILIFLTLPITIITFGLFLLIINAFIVMMAGYLVPNFTVTTIWWALLFSVLLTVFETILFSVIKED
jgi:putative membrane protein